MTHFQNSGCYQSILFVVCLLFMSACVTNKDRTQISQKRLALLKKNAEIMNNTEEDCLEYTAKKLGCKLLKK